MGKTYKHGHKWKKDRRDKHFQESKKFKDFQHDHQHRQRPNDTRPAEDPSVEDGLADT